MPKIILKIIDDLQFVLLCYVSWDTPCICYIMWLRNDFQKKTCLAIQKHYNNELVK